MSILAPSHSDSVTMSNLTGHPAVVFPGGFVDELPVALMLTGKLWDEATLFVPPRRSISQRLAQTASSDLANVPRLLNDGSSPGGPYTTALPTRPERPIACCDDRLPFQATGACSDTPSTRAFSLPLRSYLITSN